MYLSKVERKEVMTAYGYEDSTEINHYEVGPDAWIYLFYLPCRLLMPDGFASAIP